MSATRVYPIPVGLYCVPAAIVALTGADLESVVFPALNKAQDGNWLTGPVDGVRIDETERALGLMNWRVFRYKGDDLRAKLFTWARRSAEKYPGRRFLVATREHMLALVDGRVYDTFTPYGAEDARAHPFANDVVRWVAVITPR